MAEVANINVLCVDDEIDILNALRRNLRLEKYNIVTTESPVHALKLLSENEFATVVSDYRMPEMLGTEFLSRVKHSYPDTQRVLLTGQADMKSVMTAVNDGGVHKFFLKPCDNLTFKHAIRECIKIYSLKQENETLTRQLESANKQLSNLNQDLTVKLRDTANRLDESEFYDARTGLPNQKLLIKNADSLLSGLIQSKSNDQVVFIVIGILDYELLNEALEKDECNQILLKITNKLTHNLRVDDLIARIRDDCFCIVSKTGGSTEEVEGFANRLVMATVESSSTRTRHSYINVKAGIDIYDDEHKDSETLLENALTAWHRARKDSNAGIVFYDHELSVDASSKVSLSNDLSLAAKNQAFTLNFQPRVDAQNKRIVAVEVLLRWQHPTRGMVSPVEFIPILEETGLIEFVGEWVIRETCNIAQRLASAGYPLLFAVNVSPYQLRTDSFRQLIADSIDRSELPLNQFLELEITESLLVTGNDNALASIRQLKDLGIKIAIDDFGTGYSSLSYLAEVPADYLKIDQSFVKTLSPNNTTHAIVTSIISIAKALGLGIIAEGIETEFQSDLLRDMGCHEFQGYLFSRPIDETSLVELLARERADRADLPSPIHTVAAPASASMRNREMNTTQADKQER